jgi:putative sigma-54 modulation protein
MTSEEAALQMELVDHPFFVFRDAESGQFAVLYKRKDGNYGILEPEA